MTNSSLSSLSICPINFKAFDSLNSRLNNVDATLLLSKIKFHQSFTKIKKFDRAVIARSRKQIASWFGFSTKKIDRILGQLEETGLIEKTVGLWYGKKRIFISASTETNMVPVNLDMLGAITDYTGSVRTALIFSKIAFAYANTKIEHEDKKWCCLNKGELSKWAGLSIRTIDSLLDGLCKKGLILKKKFLWRDKIQTHFHIPDFVITTINKTINRGKDPITSYKKPNKIIGCQKQEKVINSHNCRELPAKRGLSIRIRSNLKETNNITSDINFELVGENLSWRQLKYLRAAFTRTANQQSLIISSPKDLWEQLKFSVLNIQQHKGINSFKHVVARCMKILSDGNWRTPIGFSNHSEYGIQVKERENIKATKWKSLKEEARNQTKQFVALTDSNHHRRLTEKAIRFAGKLVEVTEEAKNAKEPRLIALCDDLIDQIQQLVHQGASQGKVVEILKKHCV